MSAKELESTLSELQELKRMREELNTEIDALEDIVKAEMGQHEQITVGAFKVTWKAVTSSRLDTVALRKALPDIAARFMKTTTCRRFQVN